MGIVVEFNPDLALRDISEFKSGNRKKEECIPEDIKNGEVYDFLKKGKETIIYRGKFLYWRLWATSSFHARKQASSF